MKWLTFVISLVVAWGNLSADCDIYIANVGPGNCVAVTIDYSKGKKKLVWIDAGSKRPRFANPETLKLYLKENVLDKDFSKGDRFLFVTHSHSDHFSLLDKWQFENKNSDSSVKFRKLLSFFDVICAPDNEEYLATIEGKTESIRSLWSILNDNSSSGGNAVRRRNAERYKVQVDNDGCYGVKARDEVNKVLKKLNTSLPQGTKWKIFFPQKLPIKKDDLNSESLIIGLEYNKFRVLFPGDATGENYDYLTKKGKRFVNKVDILIAPHHGSEEKRNSLWYSSNKLRYVIISGDPSYGSWKLPGLVNYGGRQTCTSKRPHQVYYANTEGRVLRKSICIPVFGTWKGRYSHRDKSYNKANKKFLGYHIHIDDKISIFEIVAKGGVGKEYQTDLGFCSFVYGLCKQKVRACLKYFSRRGWGREDH